jgi:hypothetical protein
MKKRDIEELFVDYFDGKLNADELKKLLSESEKYKDQFEEIDILKNIYARLDNISVPEPSENMNKNFYNMLELASKASPEVLHKRGILKYFTEKVINTITLPKISYAALLLIIGITVGKWALPDNNEKRLENLSAELTSVKEVMTLTMLQQPAPTDRIKAVSYVNSLPNVDNKVANALIETLNTDPNINVRLATVDALSAFCGNPQVRQGLIRSIANQKSPLVQVALADLMVSIHEKNSVEPLKKLLNEEGIKKSVKVKIENCITRI